MFLAQGERQTYTHFNVNVIRFKLLQKSDMKKKQHYYGCSSSWNSHYQLCLNKWNSQSGVQGTRIQSGEPYHEIAIMVWHN